MPCNIETFAYPAWWGSATTVRIRQSVAANGGSGSELEDREDVEFLPQGVATAAGSFYPWASVASVTLET
jgi:hypothetical protein